MNEIQLPQKIQIEEKDTKTATVVIEPLYPGYGLTLGNALRRVLISSLPGAAITAIKIKGIQHEFSTIPHVKEDVVDIILNIKLIRLKLLQGNNAIISLKVKGEKVVTAKDIKATAEIEVINPEQKIATLTDKNAELEIEFTVNSGLGYSPVESREKEKLEIGAIAIDAIFSPVLKARFELENVRVGQMTNYDKLTLEIVTDGTIIPSIAFHEAAKILVNHYTLLIDAKKETRQKKAKSEKSEVKETEKENLKETKKESDSKAKKEAKK